MKSILNKFKRENSIEKEYMEYTDIDSINIIKTIKEVKNNLTLVNVNVEKMIHSWNDLPRIAQCKIQQDYNDGQFTTLSRLLIEESFQRNSDADKMLDFLLSHDFTFNKKDVNSLKENNWLWYKEIGNTYFVSARRNNAIGRILSKMDRLIWFVECGFKVKKRSGIKMVDYFSQNRLSILLNHHHKLPLKISQKVFKEASSDMIKEVMDKRKKSASNNNVIDFFKV